MNERCKHYEYPSREKWQHEDFMSRISRRNRIWICAPNRNRSALVKSIIHRRHLGNCLIDRKASWQYRRMGMSNKQTTVSFLPTILKASVFGLPLQCHGDPVHIFISSLYSQIFHIRCGWTRSPMKLRCAELHKYGKKTFQSLEAVWKEGKNSMPSSHPLPKKSAGRFCQVLKIRPCGNQLPFGEWDIIPHMISSFHRVMKQDGSPCNRTPCTEAGSFHIPVCPISRSKSDHWF